MALDRGIGRIDIDHIKLPGRDRAELQSVVDPARCVEWQRVVRAQPAPAVGATDEFLGEPETQSGVRHEVRDTVDPEACCLFLRHRQRIGIVETQRP